MCLYNAVCLYLNGSEEQAHLLRLHVGIHYLLNTDDILKKAEGKLWQHSTRSREENMACVFNEKEYSDMLMVETCSQVLQRPIKTDMTSCPKNASLGPHAYRDIFGQEFHSDDVDIIEIMWTGWVSYSDSDFRFNHFVPMVPRISLEEAIHSDNQDESESDSQAESQSHTESQSENENENKNKIAEESDEDEDLLSDDESVFKGYQSDNDKIQSIKEKVKKSKFTKKRFRKKSDSFVNTKKLKKSVKQLRKALNKEIKNEKRQMTGDPVLDEEVSQNDQPIFSKLPIELAIRFISKKCIEKLPRGPKCNSRYVISNKFNAGQYKKRKPGVKVVKKCDKASYVDDLGQYISKPHYFVYIKHSDTFEHLKDLDYIQGQIVKKSNGEPISDQANLILVKTMRHNHKSGNFFKMTTEFLMAPDDMLDLLEKQLVEYVGKQRLNLPRLLLPDEILYFDDCKQHLIVVRLKAAFSPFNDSALRSINRLIFAFLIEFSELIFF